MGYVSYVPVQEQWRIRKNGRKVKVERIVIPSTVFVRCSEIERRDIVTFPFIFKFMTNLAGTPLASGRKPLAVIPDEQIDKLRFMVGNSDTPVSFSSEPYKKGDFVKIIRGNLSGLEGEVQIIDSKHSEIIVSLDVLGNARLTIETVNVERISPK